MMVASFLRASGQRVLKARQVRAEGPRGAVTRQTRRGARAGPREETLLHEELHAGRVPDAAVPPIDAAPVGAQQAARRLGRLRRLQAEHRLELPAQRAIGQALDQGPGRGRVW
jgi:hypothetical protein